VGSAVVYVDRPAPENDRGANLVLGHGAGRGSDSPDLVALARQLPSRGITVVRVDQPWVVAGRKVAVRPETLDRAWIEVLSQLGSFVGPAGRLVIGGRSAGARVACRTASDVGAGAVVAIAFPLWNPNRRAVGWPDVVPIGAAVRRAELVGASVPRGRPVLVVQGTRDRYGSPSDFRGLRSDSIDVRSLPYADHALRVPARAPVAPDEIQDLLVGYITGFVLGSASRG